MSKIVEIAASQIGVMEATGANDGVPAERYNDGEVKAWCAAFVRWVFEQAGIPLPGKRWLLPSVEYMQRILGLHGCVIPIKEFGRNCSNLRPGDIIFFNWRLDSDPGAGGRHVEILESYDLVKGRLITIGGNVGNGVRRNVRSLKGVTGAARWAGKK
jgi:cell wall-associated NlpC family hydrolase